MTPNMHGDIPDWDHPCDETTHVVALTDRDMGFVINLDSP
jgi:hypothetical protein